MFKLNHGIFVKIYGGRPNVEQLAVNVDATNLSHVQIIIQILIVKQQSYGELAHKIGGNMSANLPVIRAV